MEYGDSDREQSQVDTTMKTEEHGPDTSSLYIEINLNHLKQEPGLVQAVKREPTMLVKKEIAGTSNEDSSEQQFVDDTATPVSTGGVNETCSTCLADLPNIKYESADIDVGPTVLQHMDIHYTINKQNVSAATEENSIGDDCSEAMPDSGVKKGSAEDKWGDSLTPQNAIMKERSVREHQLASDCRVHVMTLNVFQCDICHVVHTDKLRLLQHIHTVHACRPRTSLIAKVHKTNKRTAAGNISSCFRCTACGKIFSKAHLLSAHRKLHERNSATSGATSSSVAGSSNVQRSKATKAEPKPFKCDVCEKRYSSEMTLRQHKRFHSGVGLSVCRICGAKFNLKSNLASHLRTHTGEKSFQCHTCNARFAQKSNLTTHQRVHTGEKPFQCDICNARFAQSINLTTHQRVHTGEKPYQCDTCNARFKTSGNLTIHKRGHTGEKPFQCDTCNARFTTSTDLTRHQRVHTGEKPYQCAICNARFAQSAYLIAHKRVHTGEKPYQCDICNTRFTTNGELTAHKRVHSGEKRYQCDSCNARFTNSSHLTTHKRVHTGEKPFQCDTCNARFTNSSNLTSHKRVHTGEKPFKCTECGSKFTRRSILNKHMRRRHPK